MTSDQLSPPKLDHALIEEYRHQGFVHVPAVLSEVEVETYRAAAQRVYDQGVALNPADPIFKQVVNVWKSDATLAQLTRHQKLAQYATDLAGVPLRLWHDHLLAKSPHNGAATEYHQDGPYWPHAGARHSLSAWIALVDVPVERGCMSFIPGQQGRREIRAVDLADRTDLFLAADDLTWAPRVTIPLRAGDVTFHNAYTPHTANPNDTDEVRLAHVNIYVDRELTFTGADHVCTANLSITPGSTLPDHEFPCLP